MAALKAAHAEEVASIRLQHQQQLKEEVVEPVDERSQVQASNHFHGTAPMFAVVPCVGGRTRDTHQISDMCIILCAP